MYKTSPEIEAIVIRWNEAIRTKDKGSINNMLSASEQLRYVGSAENELWSGALLRRGIGDHFDEVPDFHYRGYNIEAYESGQIGLAKSFFQPQVFCQKTGSALFSGWSMASGRLCKFTFPTQAPTWTKSGSSMKHLML